MREIRQEIQDDREAAMKKMTELSKETLDKAEAKLNDEQQKTWKELLGAPFEVKYEPRRNNEPIASSLPIGLETSHSPTIDEIPDPRSGVSFCIRPADRRRPAFQLERHRSSFDRHALGQVARLVDVAAAPPRDVVGQQLERDDRQERLDDLGRIGDRQEDVRQRGERVVALGADGDDRAVARLDLLDVAQRLGVQRAARGHEDARGLADRPARSARASSRPSDSPRRGYS